MHYNCGWPILTNAILADEVKAVLFNPEQTQISAALVCAFYDTTGRMTNVKTLNVDTAEEKTVFHIPVPGIPNPDTRVECFLVEKGTFIPMAPA